MATQAQNDKEVTRALVRHELAWPELFKLMREPKSENRFDDMLAAMQEIVPWKEKILIPLGQDHGGRGTLRLERELEDEMPRHHQEERSGSEKGVPGGTPHHR